MIIAIKFSKRIIFVVWGGLLCFLPEDAVREPSLQVHGVG